MARRLVETAGGSTPPRGGPPEPRRTHRDRSAAPAHDRSRSLASRTQRRPQARTKSPARHRAVGGGVVREGRLGKERRRSERRGSGRGSPRSGGASGDVGVPADRLIVGVVRRFGISKPPTALQPFQLRAAVADRLRRSACRPGQAPIPNRAPAALGPSWPSDPGVIVPARRPTSQAGGPRPGSRRPPAEPGTARGRRARPGHAGRRAGGTRPGCGSAESHDGAALEAAARGVTSTGWRSATRPDAGAAAGGRR